MVGIISLGGAQKAQAETTPTLGKKSAYTVKIGSETDYTYKTTDVDGVNSYHKIELKTPLSSSNSITWTEATSAGAYAISVQLPHNDDSANPEIKYYTYSYTKPSNYTTATGRVTDISTVGAVDKVLFQSLSSSDSGGAINNTADNSNVNITGDFRYNYAESSNFPCFGGAIYNNGKIGDIKGVFIKNHTKGALTYGGAIYNYNGTIKSLTGDFIGNYVKDLGSGSSHYYAGAVYNNGKIGHISGNFVNNYVSGQGYLYGGAIDNSGTIGDITGNFIGNYVFQPISSLASADGGAIDNSGTIGNITGDFIGNYVKSDQSYGGAIRNYGTIGNISGNFIGNYVQSTSFLAGGGAIDSSGTIGKKDATGSVVGGIINSSFIGNYAKSETGTARGGAIWTNRDLNIIAQDGYTSLISGNYVQDKDGIRPEGIYIGGTSYVSTSGEITIDNNTYQLYQMNYDITCVNLINNSNSKTIINDQILGSKTNEVIINKYYEYWVPNPYTGNDSLEYAYLDENNNVTDKIEKKSYKLQLDISGDGTGLVQLNNDVINLDVSLTNSTLHLGARDNVLDGNNLTLNSGTLNMINNQAGVSALNSLTVNGDTNFVADVDLEAQTMDRFTADSYGQHAGNLNVVGMNLLTDAPEDREVTEIYFAQQGLKDNVAYGGAELPHYNYQTTFYTPIYKYNAIYDNRDDAGYFVFTKANNTFVPTPDSGTNGGGTSTPIITPSGNPSDAFNPAVLGSSTSATVGAIGTMNTTMHYAFQNAENYMHIPYLERIAHRDRNKYALSPTGDATDVGTFSPLFNKKEYGSAWVKPYATFENVALKNGPKVSNITYGTLIGFDTDIESIKNGWDRTFTGYIAYNGASQRYSGVDSYQNGGLIGGTMTLYKGNFFNATTLSVGANVASNSTMYGNDNYTMLLGGIGNKAGYNFEIKEGKLIFQPSMLVSYTWVNTFVYTNAAGVKIENDPLHAIQLAPGVKLIGNTKNGWQPYIGVSMVWNLMGKSDATANGVRLPAMSIKPYVQYGVGVQKRFKDHFMGFGQVMVHSGGRNGVSINGGFRWALGHDCNCQKVEGKGLFKFAHKNKEVEAQPYDIMYRGNQQFGLYNRKVIKQMASVERVKAMK